MDNIHELKEATLTVKKKTLVLVLFLQYPYKLGLSRNLNHLKNFLNCCKLQVVFKNKTKSGNAFHFKDHIPKDLTSGVVYKLQCGLYNEPY